MMNLPNLTQVHFQLDIKSKENSSFGSEDAQVLKSIFRSYNQFLSPSSKQANRFIGKVKRSLLQNDPNILETLDIVYVYQRVVTMMGNTLPFIAKHVIKTQWNDGTPISISHTDQETCNGTTNFLVYVTTYPFETSIVTEQAINETYTDFLYCLPKFSCDYDQTGEFQYYLENQDLDVGFNDIFSKCIQRSFGFLHVNVKCAQDAFEEELPIDVQREEDEFEDEQDSEETHFSIYSVDQYKSPIRLDEDFHCDFLPQGETSDDSEREEQEDDNLEDFDEEDIDIQKIAFFV